MITYVFNSSIRLVEAGGSLKLTGQALKPIGEHQAQ